MELAFNTRSQNYTPPQWLLSGILPVASFVNIHGKQSSGRIESTLITKKCVNFQPRAKRYLNVTFKFNYPYFFLQIYFHGKNMFGLQKYITPQVLPLELGGDQNITDKSWLYNALLERELKKDHARNRKSRKNFAY